ncbi:branched-chain amino acid ABC transporter permease [Sulfitobacter sp. KE29]|jgi:branched-chain amino acid transport system permease protein|uniref:branched-chain amino acid ABC transporter permease n=1 Tax=Roseobacteraceae TaxID=2854170 RepID=UPI0023E2F8AC|nr:MULTISPECIES: branched-chain amino acid ABC transporter permease [Sulfitobacter]MDF3420128.1 branched-chain amino acid ABC transporter permease [Sulfitobacter sp. Ks38]MDF3427613.1 branched-chain amino acid ABC transporter permease [Sulfitobacter sp. KE29]MDF3431192.1 branched-chain amino acid ABC transporter permease [Sulfitobacter sp. S46]MDF3445965.1 branched-chain amino acid ABC transporter permease [Sulfitobacter sp. KE31]MDF3549974.1 branched-chain amino acid ABC transporter permease 
MSIRIIIPAILLLLLALVPFVAQTLQVLLTLALAKGIAVMGITVLLRSGQVSFGHALFFAIAAYGGAFTLMLMPGADLIVVFLLGVLAAVLSGILVGLFVARYRFIFFAMLNLAFSMIFWSILEKFYHYTGGADGMRLPRPTVFWFEMERGAYELLMFYLSLALAIGLGWFSMRWLESPAGQLFRTLKTNETRLQYLGMSPQRVMMNGYVLSAMLCGTGGILMGLVQGVVTPEYAYWIRSGEMVFIAVLGGAGSVPGALVGAAIYEIVRTYASAFAGDVWQMVLGGFLLIIILFAPGGIAGIYNSLIDRIAGTKEDGE